MDRDDSVERQRRVDVREGTTVGGSSQRTAAPRSRVSRATTTSAGSCAKNRSAVAPTCSREEQWMKPLLWSNGEPSKRPAASNSVHSAGRRIL